MPRISILLPYRNAAATLEAAVASMVGQSSAEWELLLVDNASTDDGPAIAARWAASDARIRLLPEGRVGIAHALNTGLTQAKGAYIARMDADDVSLPERLAKQLAYLDAHTEVGVLGTRTRFESSVEKSIGMRAYVDWQNALITPEQHYLKRFVDAPLAHPTVLFRRELVERFGGYNSGPLPEDHELWFRWMHGGVRFAKLPEELLIWNDGSERLSRTHANYSVDAFFATKAQWIAKWLARKYPEGRPLIIAGTSKLCRDRAAQLEAQGLLIHAFTDVRRRELPGYRFIAHEELPGPGEALVISFISQRGTGERIAEFLASRGLVEGEDFILAA